MRKLFFILSLIVTGFVASSQTLVGTKLILDNVKYDSLVTKAYIENHHLFVERAGQLTDYGFISGSTDTLFAGGETTTNNTANVGWSPGTNITLREFIQKAYYGYKPPIATLSGGATLELTSSSTVSQTLNWTGCRQSNTPILTSIVVAGVTKSFSQPDTNNCASGTQTALVPANTTTTYSNIVIANDGQADTAKVTFNFNPKWYYGFVDDAITSPNDAAIIALIGTLTTSLNTVKTQSASGIAVSNSDASRFVVAVPTSFESPNALEIWVNGLNVTGAFTKTTRSFTNASGYAQNYNIYVQNTITSAGITFQIK